MKISIGVDLVSATKGINAVTKQIPFATALAVTSLAKQVQGTETAALPSVFDRPTPFTKHAFGMTAARKGNPQAEVFAKMRQAAYLEPSEDQGFQVLGAGRKIRTPVDIKLNQYGDITKGKIVKLAAKSGYFVGVVKGVNALWQRLPKGKLRLLVAFTRPVEVKTNLDFQDRARKTVEANFTAVFRDALRKALETSR